MKRVAIIYGGWSSEREISLISGAKMAEAAREIGYDVVEIDASRTLAQKLVEADPDIILNGLHGPWGEDGCVQGLFEVLDIPYSHSGVLASALAMDKIKSKLVFAEAGLDVAKDVAVTREQVATGHPLVPPYVVKPVNEGSSFGVLFVREGSNGPARDVLGPDWHYGDDLMAEEFIPGRELTVGVLGDRALAVTEITTLREFYDFNAKYTDGGSRHVIPADIPETIAEAAKTAALTAHQVLGCRGVTRSDFRYDPDKDRLVILETNTQPGMTPFSLVPEQANYCGMSYAALVEWMIEDASCRR
ncbi:MAG: D-alanine--D-alanine ligase [Hyphomonadaceae bacterium]|nr:D-alanine--D-alanine ligase [Hyphomonadaceae bacterium]OUX94304.1 MAG: D-alanine--D-alanine ligase [Hyphomonas sp. TMED17]CAI8399567.1 MAG: D-alanine--D-alanine ligase B [Hyphomonas sp. TMED17]